MAAMVNSILSYWKFHITNLCNLKFSKFGMEKNHIIAKCTAIQDHVRDSVFFQVPKVASALQGVFFRLVLPKKLEYKKLAIFCLIWNWSSPFFFKYKIPLYPLTLREIQKLLTWDLVLRQLWGRTNSIL